MLKAPLGSWAKPCAYTGKHDNPGRETVSFPQFQHEASTRKRSATAKTAHTFPLPNYMVLYNREIAVVSSL